MRNSIKLYVSLALLVAALPAEADKGDILKVATGNVTATYVVSGDATVTLGNGYNSCISEYTDGSYAVPATVTSGGTTYAVTAIAPYAFQFCTDITSVTIPEGVTAIGEYAFNACSKLSEVSLPASLKTIGDGAFYNCTALTKVTAAMRAPENTFGFSNVFQNLVPKKTLKVPAGKKKYYLADQYEMVSLWEKYFDITSDPQTFSDSASGLDTEFSILDDGTVQLLKATNVLNAEHATYGSARYTDTTQGIDETYDITSLSPEAFAGNDGLLWVDFTRSTLTLANTDRSAADAPLCGMSPYTLVFLPEGRGTTGENIVNTADGKTFTCQALRLSSDRAYDIPYAFHTVTATLERNFTAGRYATVFAPFAIIGGDKGTFYALKGYDAQANELHFGETETATPNHAYLFLPATAVSSFEAEDVDVVLPDGAYTPEVTPAADTETGAAFYGVYRRTAVPEGAFGYLASDYDKDGNSYGAGTFVRAGSNVTTKPYRAFLWLADAGAGAKRVVIDGNETGITAPAAAKEERTVIFNIAGQRVTTPHRGLYIINGKKTIVK